TLSRHRIGCPHLGQALPFSLSDSRRGTRQMTTLRNDPMRSPRMPASTTTKAATTGSAVRARTVTSSPYGAAPHGRSPKFLISVGLLETAELSSVLDGGGVPLLLETAVASLDGDL